ESQKIMNLLQELTDTFYQVSIDEAYLSLDILEHIYGCPLKAAKYIRKYIFQKTGYTCSIGVAKCAKVAKIASDFQKPHGVTVVYNSREFLSPLHICKIPGIGRKTISQYTRRGLHTIGDIAKKSVFYMQEHFGHQSVRFLHLANGTRRWEIPKYEDEKSLSVERTFTHDCYARKELIPVLQDILEKIGKNSRGLCYKTVSLKIRYSSFETITRSFTAKTPISHAVQFHAIIFDLLTQVEWKKGVRLIGVKIQNFQSNSFEQTVLCQYTK
ncbi:MAG: hypothetical protein ACMXYA_00150, partial [Candidatus Woesearchaeota archaeon]